MNQMNQMTNMNKEDPDVWIFPTHIKSKFDPKNNIKAAGIGNFLNGILIQRTAPGTQILGG